METVDLGAAGPVVLDLAAAVIRDRDRLSEIDGATGDGDHGVNMAKGFRLAAAKLEGLGERSRGHLDAGASSCELLLRTLADGLVAHMGAPA